MKTIIPLALYALCWLNCVAGQELDYVLSGKGDPAPFASEVGRLFGALQNAQVSLTPAERTEVARMEYYENCGGSNVDDFLAAQKLFNQMTREQQLQEFEKRELRAFETIQDMRKLLGETRFSAVRVAANLQYLTGNPKSEESKKDVALLNNPRVGHVLGLSDSQKDKIRDYSDSYWQFCLDEHARVISTEDSNSKDRYERIMKVLDEHQAHFHKEKYGEPLDFAEFVERSSLVRGGYVPAAGDSAMIVGKRRNSEELLAEYFEKTGRDFPAEVDYLRYRIISDEFLRGKLEPAPNKAQREKLDELISFAPKVAEISAKDGSRRLRMLLDDRNSHKLNDLAGRIVSRRQVQRLNQFELQLRLWKHRASFGTLDKSVRRAMQLSADQVTAIKDILRRDEAQLNVVRKELEERIEQRRQAEAKNSIDVLTKQQLAKFEKVVGPVAELVRARKITGDPVPDHSTGELQGGGGD